MSKHQIITPRYLKISGAAQYTGLSQRTIAQLVADQVLRSGLVGRSRLIDRESLDAYIEAAFSKDSGSTPVATQNTAPS